MSPGETTPYRSQSNLGPGGCVSWDDFAEWLRRVDVHVTALKSAAFDLEPLNVSAGPLLNVIDTLRVEVDAAMVVCKVER